MPLKIQPEGEHGMSPARNPERNRIPEDPGGTFLSLPIPNPTKAPGHRLREGGQHFGYTQQPWKCLCTCPATTHPVSRKSNIRCLHAANNREIATFGQKLDHAWHPEILHKGKIYISH